MKSLKIFLAAVIMLAAAGCGKEENEAPEPAYCYECTVTQSIDRGTGYASDVTTTTNSHCGITESRAKKIEQDGTWKKQQPDQWGIRLIWVDQKTICNRK